MKKVMFLSYGYESFTFMESMEFSCEAVRILIKYFEIAHAFVKSEAILKKEGKEREIWKSRHMMQAAFRY